jgi:hypothetical protein
MALLLVSHAIRDDAIARSLESWLRGAITNARATAPFLDSTQLEPGLR